MFKIKVDGKELKGIIEKALCNMNKKLSVSILNKIVLQSGNNILSATTSKVAEYLKVYTNNYTSITDGSIAIAEEDLKVLLKMTGDIELAETEDNIQVKNGKKIISLIKYDLTDFPCEPEGEFNENLRMRESDFGETLSNLSLFTSNDKSNKMMQCFNFNLSECRIEALDGHRIGMKHIEDAEKVGICNFIINNTIVLDLKKALNKKSDKNIVVSVGEKYIKVSGNNFTYYTKVQDGEYFKVGVMLNIDYDTRHMVERDVFLNHIKYYTDNVITKNFKNPVVFKITDGKIVTYARNHRFEVSDEMKISDYFGKDLTIAFNPYFLLDSFKVADAENITMRYTNNKAPLFIDADKYSFLVLPVNLISESEAMEKYLSKIEVA